MWGVVSLVPRLFDAITDPIMGFISDNTKSKWGRRRQYVFIGGYNMGIALYHYVADFIEDGVDYNFILFMFGLLCFT